eukprot:386703_1
MLIAESSTSDIDDNIASGEDAEEEQKEPEKLKAPTMKKMSKSKSMPHRRPRSETEPQPLNVYAKNLNVGVSAYLHHLNDVATHHSPTTYTRSQSGRGKNIKQLKNAFEEACRSPKTQAQRSGKGKGPRKMKLENYVSSPGPNIKINIESEEKDHELQLGWKEYSTPVRFGSLSLEYSEDDSSGADDTLPNGNTALVDMDLSRSMPFGPSKATTKPPPPIDMSQSARNSLNNLDRDRALTFPTMALNTDNASKISAATPHQQSFKVVLIGQIRVGKKSNIRRFFKDKLHNSKKI